MPETTTLGQDYANALAAKDWQAIAKLLDPRVEFRALTPRRTWEADDPQSVIANVLQQWFQEADEIESVERIENDSFADRERVGYRFGVRRPDGRYLLEQQVYLSSDEGRISWMRVVCSGYRPIDG